MDFNGVVLYSKKLNVARMLTDVMPFPPLLCSFFCNNVVNPAPHVFPFIFMCVCKIESRDAPKGRSTPYPTTAFLALVANKMQQQHRFVPHFVKKLRSNNSKGFMHGSKLNFSAPVFL